MSSSNQNYKNREMKCCLVEYECMITHRDKEFSKTKVILMNIQQDRL